MQCVVKRVPVAVKHRNLPSGTVLERKAANEGDSCQQVSARFVEGANRGTTRVDECRSGWFCIGEAVRAGPESARPAGSDDALDGAWTYGDREVAGRGSVEFPIGFEGRRSLAVHVEALYRLLAYVGRVKVRAAHGPQK